MSEELVDRLREWNRQYSGKMPDDIIAAADLIEFLRQQLADHIKREVMLRDALGELVALKNLKDRAESAEDSSTNAYCGTEYATRKPAAWKSAKEALAATADLKDVILCHAEPITLASGVTLNTTKGYIHIRTGDSLYRAWEQK